MTQESPVVLCKYCCRVIATDPVEYMGEKYHSDCWQKARPDSECKVTMQK